MRPVAIAAASVAALVFLTGAAPAPDPLLGRIVADARAVPPSAIAFERQIRTTTQEKGGASASGNRVDRWDGRTFTLLSLDGKAPGAKDIDEFRKTTAARPVPGYHRIADLLKAGAVRQTDAQGRTVYKLTGLPKGTIKMGKDLSADMVGEFMVDGSGAQPYVTRVRFVLPKPLSFFMVARLDSLEIISDYKLDSNGRPYLAHSVQAMSGAQFGKQGSTRVETSYTMLR